MRLHVLEPGITPYSTVKQISSVLKLLSFPIQSLIPFPSVVRPPALEFSPKSGVKRKKPGGRGGGMRGR